MYIHVQTHSGRKINGNLRHNRLPLSLAISAASTSGLYMTHCNTLQYSAAHNSALQHALFTVTGTLHHTAPHCNTLHHTATQKTKANSDIMYLCLSQFPQLLRANCSDHTATNCNTLQHPAMLCNTSLRTLTNMLHHTVTNCNALPKK